MSSRMSQMSFCRGQMSSRNGIVSSRKGIVSSRFPNGWNRELVWL
jgi:hypothetical protein